MAAAQNSSDNLFILWRLILAQTFCQIRTLNNDRLNSRWWTLHRKNYASVWLFKYSACRILSTVLASWLIYAKPFRHPFRGNPAPISVLVWVRSFIEPYVLKTKVPFDNTAQIYLTNLHWKLGLGFKLRLRVALF